MKNKFLKNKIVLVAVMILLGSFSIALAAPGDAPSRPPVHPGNSSQPVLNLKVGGSNLASAGLDVAGSDALSFFDKVDSFITVFGRLWIGGNTWLGSPNLFTIQSTDIENPGLISLPIRTLNIVGTFLSSTLGHDGTIAAQRAVCVQNSKLILCTAPAVTYQWDIGAWGPCSGGATTGGSCSGTYAAMGTKINWAGQPYNWTLGEEYDTGTTACTIYRIASCVPGNCNWTYEAYSYDAYGFTNGVGASGYDPTCGYNFSGQDTPIETGIAGPATSFTTVACSGSNPTTESSCESQNSACTWTPNAGTGTQTRAVVCKDSNGTTVADSFCVAPKPSTTQACTNSTPPTGTSSGNIWYCHLGQWVDYESTCSNENYPAGYKWEQVRVCTTADLSGANNCEPDFGSPEYDLPNAPSSIDCFWSSSTNQWECTD